MSDISIGYVGLDHHHRDIYFDLFEQLPVRVTSVAEPNESFDVDRVAVDEDRPDSLEVDADVGETLREATVYRDPEALIATEDVDLVWLTLPNRDTPAVVEAAVDHGIDVFSEKPMARTAAELEPVARKASRRDVTVGTSYFYRCHPVVADLKRRVAEGFFGEIWAVEARFIGTKLAYRRTDHALYDRDASRGGALQWIGCHYLDLLGFVLDEAIVRVNAQMDTFGDASVDVEDAVTLQFELESGAIGTFTTGYYLRASKDSNLSIYGRDGWAETPLRDWTDRSAPIELGLDSESDADRGAPHRTVTYDVAFDRPPFGDFGFQFFERFLDACRDESAPPVGIDDALWVLRVMDAAYESAAAGDWVAVEAAGSG